ncbi:MAG: MFS transporter [Caldilineaceae bacterium]|nr:MFS transporter [Caldilineaceae bacterium]
MPKHSPTDIFLIISGGRAFFNALVFTINLVYQVETVGLNPLQLVLVGTVLEVTAVLFEVPTGTVADLYSRRLSVIVGMALIGCGFLLEGSIPRFWAVLGAQVLWGTGYTFISGALQAWLADEIGADAAGPVFLRSSQVGLAAGLVGTGLSAWLARGWLQLPILAGGALYIVLAAYLALTMPERGFRPASAAERDTWKRMVATARAGLHAVRSHPALRILVGLSLVTGLYSEGYERLWTPHLLQNFSFPLFFGQVDHVIWFGVIGVGATTAGIAATELARRGKAAEVHARLVAWLTLLYALLPASLLLLAWTRAFWFALLALWLINLCRSTLGPLENAWIVRITPSAQRATVISLWGQANSTGQVVGGPFVGWIGTITRIPVALTVSMMMMLPAQWLLFAARRGEAPHARAVQSEEKL